jgi:uncharacterized membrane protein YgdD (TMEM256/DUF423 family)
MPRFLMIVAGLMGATGVILAALAAHKAQGLEPAALMLLVDAPAIIAAAAATEAGLLNRALAHAAATGLALGAILFSADIALLTLAGVRLFPMAAPIGGSTMIAAWLTLAAAALRRPTP